MVTVLVIGLGIVGTGWVKIFCRAPQIETVYVYDSSAEAMETLEVIIKTNDQLTSQEKGKMLILKYLSRLENGLKIDYIQECIDENFINKRNLLTDLNEVYKNPENVWPVENIPCLGSSSSTFSPVDLFKGLKPLGPRSLTVHPNCPVEYMPLVELVFHPKTDIAVVKYVEALMISCKKSPVIIGKPLPGYAMNRLQYALIAEALRLVEDKVIMPKDVDRIVKLSLAPQWCLSGPFQIMANNAPNGVIDYCKRNQQLMNLVVRSQDNSRTISSETIKIIDQETNQNRDEVSELLSDLLHGLNHD